MFKVSEVEMRQDGDLHNHSSTLDLCKCPPNISSLYLEGLIKGLCRYSHTFICVLIMHHS